MTELKITKTSKSYSPKDFWAQYATEYERFPTMADAKKWLNEHYAGNKRSKMYNEPKTGEDFHCGYIIGQRCSWGGDSRLEQHWTEFRESDIVNLDAGQ